MEENVPTELLTTEDAVETADGLVTMLSYVHDVAPEGDRKMLHTPIGFTLNAIRNELQRARSGYEGLYKRHWSVKREQV